MELSPFYNLSNSTNDSIECSNDYCETDAEYIARIQRHLIPNTGEVFLICMYVAVFLSGVIGNCLVIVVVLRNVDMRTVTNMFLVNLAIGDFLVILFCLPTTLLEDIRETWYFGSVTCRVAKFLQHTSVTVSVLTLTVTSVERFLAICYPLKPRPTVRRAVFILILIWLLALAVAIPQAVTMDTYQDDNIPEGVLLLTICKATWTTDVVLLTKFAEMVILFLLPLVWMLYAYSRIVRVLWSARVPGQTTTTQNNFRSTLRSRNGTPAANATSPSIRSKTETNGGGDGGTNPLRQRRRAALMLILVVVMFFTCYLPIHLIGIVTYAHIIHFTLSANQASILQSSATFAHWLCYFNSCINPVIYYAMSTRFKSEFRRHLCCCSPRGTEAHAATCVGMGIGSNPPVRLRVHQCAAPLLNSSFQDAGSSSGKEVEDKCAYQLVNKDELLLENDNAVDNEDDNSTV